MNDGRQKLTNIFFKRMFMLLDRGQDTKVFFFSKYFTFCVSYLFFSAQHFYYMVI